VSNKKFLIRRSCNTFAPGNLKATADNIDYRALVTYWIDNKYTLRYSGGLVPDIYHILTKVSVCWSVLYTTLYFTVLYFIVFYCTVQICIVLYCT
jgi:hypothetical protein